jgi:uncharacterized SAM-binding protein YcdF (DUF218 family)
MLFWLKKFVSYWMMPLPFCLVTLIAGVVLLHTKRFARLGRIVLVAGVALLGILSNKFVSLALIRPLETRYPAIADLRAGAPLLQPLAACKFVVVLGGGHGLSPDMAATSLLSTAALARVVEAVRLLNLLPEARMIVSGPKTGKDDEPSHAAVLARAAQTLGIAADRIIFIEDAHDTEDESQSTRRLVGDAPIALVTSAAHMPRSMALARNAGLNALACPADYRAHAIERFHFDDLFWEIEALQRSHFAVRERIGYLWIWLRGKT